MATDRKLEGHTIRRARTFILLLSAASILLLSAAILAPAAARAQTANFTPPTKEELAMTSLPGYPGAAAVVLYREQVTNGEAHATYFYNRIKILTEEDKKYANVELSFTTFNGQWGWKRSDMNVGDIVAANLVTRIANLQMDATGQVSGTIDIAYSGASAQHWHRVALAGDEDSLKHELRTSLEDLIPHSLEIKDLTVSSIDDYEKPLSVSYTVEGTVGAWTGKRLVLPADLFLANEKAAFPEEKRDIAVDFHYPTRVLDGLRISFPAALTVEASPSPAKFTLPRMGVYGMSVAAAPTSFTTHREYDFGEVFVLPAEYPQLRTFYSQFQANDQQSVIFKSTGAAAAAATTSGH